MWEAGDIVGTKTHYTIQSQHRTSRYFWQSAAMTSSRYRGRHERTSCWRPGLEVACYSTSLLHCLIAVQRRGLACADYRVACRFTTVHVNSCSSLWSACEIRRSKSNVVSVLAHSALVVGKRTTTTVSHRHQTLETAVRTPQPRSRMQNWPARVPLAAMTGRSRTGTRHAAWGLRTDLPRLVVSHQTAVPLTPRNPQHPSEAKSSFRCDFRDMCGRMSQATSLESSGTLLRRLQSREALDLENTRTTRLQAWYKEPE